MFYVQIRIFLHKFAVQDLFDLAAVKAHAGAVAVVIGQQEITITIDDGGIAIAVIAVIFDKELPVTGEGLTTVLTDSADIGCSAPGLVSGTAVEVGFGIENGDGIFSHILNEHRRSRGGEEIVRTGNGPAHSNHTFLLCGDMIISYGHMTVNRDYKIIL